MVHAEDTLKSPMGPADFHCGLEVDSRQMNEKFPSPPETVYHNGRRRAEMRSPIGSKEYYAPSTYGDAIPRLDSDDEDKEVLGVRAQESQPSRIHRHKKLFIVSSLILLALVIVAAVLGGVLGPRRSRDDSAPPAPSAANSTESPTKINSRLPSSDVMVGSPLVPITYIYSENRETNIHLFYQNAAGHTQQFKKQGISSWTRMKNPLFTDAVNNTGLAAISYKNASTPQPSLFYVGNSNTNLREKRLYANDSRGEYWDLGSLSYEHVPVQGAPGFNDDENSKQGSSGNGWAEFRIAAVYSDKFPGGGGARLFVHKSNSTGGSWIQEWIWTQANDTWTEGASIFDGLAESHLSAAVDITFQTLRLFYATSNNTISESWLNLTDPSSTYQPGINIPCMLRSSSADIATISTSSGTLLYYTSADPASSEISIREISLPEPSSLDTPSFQSTTVSKPALLASNTGSKLLSHYAPIGAIAIPANGDEEEGIRVFWVEDVEDQRSGYGAMKTISRTVNGNWADGEIESLPLEGSG